LIEQQSREAEVGRRKQLLWTIERMLAEDDVRPIIFYNPGGTCQQPYVKGLTIMVNSIFNGWRMEDVLARQVDGAPHKRTPARLRKTNLQALATRRT
jgi:hypothetical protein